MIEPIRDRRVIEAFMSQPEIYRYAATPGAGENATFTTDNPQEMWLGFYVDGELGGLIKVHVDTGCMAIFHQYLLRKHKGLYKDFGLKFFQWMKANMPKELLKLNAYVPVIFQNTIDIAVDGGMTIEGTDTMSYRHQNGVCDRVLLGIQMVDIK